MRQTQQPRVPAASHLQGHDAGIGAILVDLVHGPLQCHSLLGEVLQVLRALLGFLMRLTHLRKFIQLYETALLRYKPAFNSPTSLTWFL